MDRERMKGEGIDDDSPKGGGGGRNIPVRNLIQDPRDGIRVAVSIRRLADEPSANRFLGGKGGRGRVERGSLRRWRFRRGP